jgi:hypothetical protein
VNLDSTLRRGHLSLNFQSILPIFQPSAGVWELVSQLEMVLPLRPPERLSR